MVRTLVAARESASISLELPTRWSSRSTLGLVASAADQLEDELTTLERQRDRYAMAAEAATDPKVSLGHLRNVERLEEEIEALRKALAAMPSKADRRSAEQAVEMGFEWDDGDDEQTRVFDASMMPAEPEPEPEPKQAPLAKPVVATSVSAMREPPRVREVAEIAQPHPAEISTPFGRVQAPFSDQDRSFDMSASGPIELDTGSSGLRRASTVILVVIVFGAVVGALWYAFAPPAPPPRPASTTTTPTVIEAAPVPSDADHR